MRRWGRWGEGGSQVVSEWGGDRWSKSCTTVECCTKTRAAVNRWVGSETTTSWKTRQGILRWHWEFRISETAKIRQAHFFLFYDFFLYLCSPPLSLVSLPLFFQRSPFPHSVWSLIFLFLSFSIIYCTFKFMKPKTNHCAHHPLEQEFLGQSRL